jgi:hypothetical protein
LYQLQNFIAGKTNANDVTSKINDELSLPSSSTNTKHKKKKINFIIKENNKIFSGFEFDNNTFQKLYEAAFSKCFMFVLDEEILDEDEIRERIINYLKSSFLV